MIAMASADNRTLARMDRASLSGCTAQRVSYDARAFMLPRESGPMTEPYRWHNLMQLVERKTGVLHWQAWNRNGPIMAPSPNRQDALDAVDQAEGGPVTPEKLAVITQIRAAYEADDARSRLHRWQDRLEKKVAGPLGETEPAALPMAPKNTHTSGH